MKKRTSSKQSEQSLANHELVVLAAYLAGAQTAAVDTEDVAVKANELSPGRFTWRKYPEQINIETVRKRLWDATKPEKGGLLIGSEKNGWRLTKVGFDFARKQARRAPVIQTKPRVSQIESVARTREVKRMLTEAAFEKFVSGQQTTLTKADAERFFRIDDYVTGSSRTAKIERFRIMAARNSQLIAAIDYLSSLLMGG